ncbi:hypothetical protein PHET_01574 [Paragonimus heterotremus]|uniref:Uncharacterized protein n=1 Tax=Paragonimus heterotremus TaxID=100268 RepID=A0A8J4X332_9TREM|nr:hypothetical protein PHET_01574 [Paragonimus heterotremus]
MCRLVRRYIHQSKKTMRQDGVNEDDLLEIKQDISSLRYELREDRKREVARTIGHLEGLKRDLVEEIAKQMASLKPLIPSRDGLDNHNLNKSHFAQETIPPVRQRVPMDINETPTSDVNQSKIDLVRQQPRIATEMHTASADTDRSKMFSIAYGRETQYMYDEIKQLALVSNAFEGASGTMQQQRTLPVCTYLQLKQDILQGVREELKNSFGKTQTECGPAQSYSQSKSNHTRSMSTVDKTTFFARPAILAKAQSGTQIDSTTLATQKPKLQQPPRPLIRQSHYRSTSPVDHGDSAKSTKTQSDRSASTAVKQTATPRRQTIVVLKTGRYHQDSTPSE